MMTGPAGTSVTSSEMTNRIFGWLRMRSVTIPEKAVAVDGKAAARLDACGVGALQDEAP